MLLRRQARHLFHAARAREVLNVGWLHSQMGITVKQAKESILACTQPGPERGRLLVGAGNVLHTLMCVDYPSAYNAAHVQAYLELANDSHFSNLKESDGHEAIKAFVEIRGPQWSIGEPHHESSSGSVLAPLPLAVT